MFFKEKLLIKISRLHRETMILELHKIPYHPCKHKNMSTKCSKSEKLQKFQFCELKRPLKMNGWRSGVAPKSSKIRANDLSR